MFRFDVFPIAWLTTAASGGCRLKSAAAVDAKDVPIVHDGDESSRLRSARVSVVSASSSKELILAEVLSAVLSWVGIEEGSSVSRFPMFQ